VTATNSSGLTGESSSSPTTSTIVGLPSVTSLKVTGKVKVAELLTAKYSFNSNGGGADASTFQWYLNNKPISGETRESYTVLRNNVKGSITVIVTPKTQQGLIGSIVKSSNTSAVLPISDGKLNLHNPQCTYKLAGSNTSGRVLWTIDNVSDPEIKVIFRRGSSVYTSSAFDGGRSGLPAGDHEYKVNIEDQYGNSSEKVSVSFMIQSLRCNAWISAGGTIPSWPN